MTLDEVAGFVAWLRLPPEARDGRVAVPPSVEHHCTPSSVNRKLAVTWFYEFHTRRLVRQLEARTPGDPRARRLTPQPPKLTRSRRGFAPDQLTRFGPGPRKAISCQSGCERRDLNPHGLSATGT